jgi:hypothetical protein
VTNSPYAIGAVVVGLAGVIGGVLKWLMSTIDSLRKDSKDQTEALLKEVMPLLSSVAVAMSAQAAAGSQMAAAGTKMADTMQSALADLAVIHDRSKGRS